MRLRGAAFALLFAAAVAGCGVTIADVNERPDRFYQQTVDLTGNVRRLEPIPGGGTLIEMADRRNHRILVRASDTTEVAIGDWIRVHGIFVADTQVGDVSLYDVVQAERIDHAHGPRLPDIM
jgi:hypothetical protein